MIIIDGKNSNEWLKERMKEKIIRSASPVSNLSTLYRVGDIVKDEENRVKVSRIKDITLTQDRTDKIKGGVK